MKRSKNLTEMLFDQLATTASKIIMRAIILFPISMIAGCFITCKIFYNKWPWEEIWLAVVAVCLSFTIYSFIVMTIYEDKLNTYMKAICKNILDELNERAEDENALERRKFIRELKNTTRGRDAK